MSITYTWSRGHTHTHSYHDCWVCPLPVPEDWSVVGRQGMCSKHLVWDCDMWLSCLGRWTIENREKERSLLRKKRWWWWWSAGAGGERSQAVSMLLSTQKPDENVCELTMWSKSWQWLTILLLTVYLQQAVQQLNCRWVSIEVSRPRVTLDPARGKFQIFFGGGGIKAG